MRDTAMSRRALLEVAACALAASAALPALSSAEAGTGLNRRNEEIIRKYYSLWAQQSEWRPVDLMLTDDFRFTTPVDDRIGTSAFKTGCWDTQHASLRVILLTPFSSVATKRSSDIRAARRTENPSGTSSISN